MQAHRISSSSGLTYVRWLSRCARGKSTALPGLTEKLFIILDIWYQALLQENEKPKLPGGVEYDRSRNETYVRECMSEVDTRCCN